MMKKQILLVLFIISNSYFIDAQPSIQWEKSLGGTHGDRSYCIQQTTDEGFIVGGYSDSNDGDVTANHGGIDCWISKLDSTGSIQWQRALGGTKWDQANSIEQTSDGGYIIAGFSNSLDGDVTGNHGLRDYWIVKLDSAGSIQWEKSFGGTNADEANAVQQTSDGGYIIAGFSDSHDSDVTGSHGYSDFWIVKLDSSGDIQWQKALGGNNGDQAYAIKQTTDSGYIVAGFTNTNNNGDVTGNHGGFDFWVVKLNDSGVIELKKTFGGTGDEYANSICQTTDGGYIVSGFSNSINGDVTGNHGGFDFWVVKLDSTLNIQWQKSLGGSSNDIGYSIQQTIEGGYIVSGYSKSNNGNVTTNQGDADYWVVKLDNSGSLQWQKSFGGDDEEMAAGIQQTADEGYILAGHSMSVNGDVTGNHGNQDYWIIKLNSLVNVNEIQSSIAEFQVIPNPSYSEVNISFKTSFSNNSRIQIFDLDGRLVKRISFNNSITGINKLSWNLTNDAGEKINGGVYFLTITSDNLFETKKLLVLQN